MNEAVPATTPVTTRSLTPADSATPSQGLTDAPAINQPAVAPAPPLLPLAALTPEHYDLTLEGFSIDPALIQNADPVLRDIGLSNDAANKLLPVARDIMARTQESVRRQFEDAAAVQKQSWHAAYMADPEIGGARRTETEHFAAKGLDALGYAQGHPFRAALDTSGFGNHPDMIRAFRRLGELVGEDGSFVRPTTAPSRNQPVWERLYPNETR